MHLTLNYTCTYVVPFFQTHILDLDPQFYLAGLLLEYWVFTKTCGFNTSSRESNSAYAFHRLEWFRGRVATSRLRICMYGGKLFCEVAEHREGARGMEAAEAGDVFSL